MRAYRILLAVLVFAGCKKIEVRDIEKPKTPGSSSYHVYITNEGNFQAVNASISRYDPKDGDIDRSYYKDANAGLSLGDVCQSMTIKDDLIYIILNNSSRIEVVNRSDFKRTRSITGLTSPRYLEIDDTKGFVSDLYSNSISVIDVNSGNRTNTIPLKGWTEEMIRIGDELIVTNLKSDHIYIINKNNETLTDSIQTGFAPSSVRKDKNGFIWILCQGDVQQGIGPKLAKVDLQKRTAVLYPAPAGAFRLRMNSEGSSIYIAADGIYKMSIDHTSVPVTPFIPKNGRNIYGLGIDPANEDIYVSDAHDFVSEGTVWHYNNSGTLVRTFKAGINPNDFYFF